MNGNNCKTGRMLPGLSAHFHRHYWLKIYHNELPALSFCRLTVLNPHRTISVYSCDPKSELPDPFTLLSCIHVSGDNLFFYFFIFLFNEHASNFLLLMLLVTFKCIILAQKTSVIDNILYPSIFFFFTCHSLDILEQPLSVICYTQALMTEQWLISFTQYHRQHFLDYFVTNRDPCSTGLLWALSRRFKMHSIPDEHLCAYSE